MDNRTMVTRRTFLSFASLIWAFQPQPNLQAAENREIIVAAGSDLISVGSQLAARFKAKSGITVKFTYGASGQLAMKIQNGAPYDGFMSADDKYVRDLVRGRRADVPSARVVAHGRLALYSKTGKIKNINDLLKDDVKKIALANPEIAPFGQAARQIIANKEFYRALKTKLVYSQSVQEALTLAETGNADVAFVSWPSVRDKGGVKLPFDLHRPLRITATEIVGASHGSDMGRFIRFLLDKEAQTILQDAGYDAATTSGSPFKIVP
jgi:molybdate transport system substrate-binding protein